MFAVIMTTIVVGLAALAAYCLWKAWET